MNKKLFFGMFAAAGMLFATSCSNDELNVVQSGNEVQVTFSLGLEGGIGSRAISDGKTADKLVYAVYDSEGNALPVFENEAKQKTDQIGDITTTPHTVKITLAKGQTYQVAFWAQNSKCTAYNTDDLKNVTVSYKAANGTDNAVNNDEVRDAFFKAVTFEVAGNKTIDVVLKRPFAQINVGVEETDWNAAVASGVEIEKSKVVIKNAATSINLLTGAVSGDTEVTYDLNAIPTDILEVETDNTKEGKEKYKWLSMSYILVKETSGQDSDKDGTVGDAATTLNSLQFTFDPKTGKDIEFKEGLNGAPVQRNWRTNILGKILTGDIEFKISIDPIYEGDYIYPDGTDAQELEFAATFGGTVDLTEDLTLDAPLNVGADMILNIAEGKTLTGSINVAKGANLTVNGGAINNPADSTSGIVSNGNLTLNDVEIISTRHALRIESGNVVIYGGIYKVNPTSNKILYALNVGDDGTVANVIIKGGTFIGPEGTIADSGGAVAVKANSSVTIEGGDFSGGKNNTLSSKGTLTVVGGTFDQDPTEWKATDSKVIKVDDKWYVVTNDVTVIAKTAEGLAAALTGNFKNIKVILANNIDVPITSLGQQTGGSGEYKLGGESTETIEIDLNDNKLNITTTYWSAIGAKNNDALFTIKNGSMTSTGNSAGTWNAWDLRFSNCNYVFEDVDFEKAVALDNVGKSTWMKNVTITDTHNTDTYGLWITAEGQTVTLEDCVIDMTPATDGRGIKIDEQYVATPAKVTLNVKNVTFKTEEKSAILVKSVAGAEINALNLNIENVAADNVNAVWVDADAADYADKVIVNGASKFVEPTIVNNVTSLKDAFNEGGNVVLSENITLTERLNVAEGANVNLDLNGKTITLEGTSADPAFYTYKGSTLTITGNGRVEIKDPSVSLIFPGGDVVIENGTFVRNVPAGTPANQVGAFFVGAKVSPWGSQTVTINGGYFDGGYYNTDAADVDEILAGTKSLTETADDIAKRGISTDANAVRVAIKQNVQLLLNLSYNLFKVYGGTFVGANPAWGDEGCMLPTTPNYLRPWSYYQGALLDGQTFNENELVIPTGYEITKGATADGRPTYTVTYNK